MSVSGAVLLLAAYLLGSVPWGLVIARLVRGIDIRQHGSGNIGATNVGRVVGQRWGLLVLLLDAIKGIVPVALLPRLLLSPDDPARLNWEVGAGVSAICGHMFPCWLRFQGGKGVATGLGVAIALDPLAALAAASTFAAVFGIWRYVSAASMVAALVFGTVEIWTLWPEPFGRATWSLALFSVLAPLLIIVRHRANLARLWRGTESRFGRSQKTAAGPAATVAAANSTSRPESPVSPPSPDS